MAQIGLQLYTLRCEADADLPAVLRAVHEIGYAGVEFAKLPAEPAEQIGSLLRSLDLTASGIVAPLLHLQDKHEFARLVDFSYEVGSSMVLFPWLDESMRRDAAGYCEAAMLLNRYGRICMDHGLRLLYHTHGYEFMRCGEHTGLEILMQRCDDELVGLQIDTYWAATGGADPVALCRKYAHRCPAAHIKDMAPGGLSDTEVGCGIIDIAGVVHALSQSTTEWLIVEQEHFDRPPMESAAIGYRNLSAVAEGERTSSPAEIGTRNV